MAPLRKKLKLAGAGVRTGTRAVIRVGMRTGNEKAPSLIRLITRRTSRSDSGLIPTARDGAQIQRRVSVGGTRCNRDDRNL